MSTLSMTGFGRGSEDGAGCRVQAEVSSVNRRQFDCRVALPFDDPELAERCRSQMRGKMSRGSVQISVSLERRDDADPAAVDEERVRACAARLRATARAAGIGRDLSLSDLIGALNAVQTAEPDAGKLGPLVESAVAKALGSHDEMRRREGALLRKDLESRLDAMERIRLAVAARAPELPVERKAALAARVAELGAPVSPDDPTLAREIAFFAEHCDIAEELTRLAAHFRHARELFDAAEPCGRKLDFLAQEMNREANTIASKAQDAAVAASVIELKALIETFREQIQNLE